MDNSLQPNKKYLLFVFYALIAFVVIGTMLFFTNPKKTPPTTILPTPTTFILPTSVNTTHFSVLQKTLPGKTTATQALQGATIKQQTVLANGIHQYILESTVLSRNDEIRTQQGIVVLEKVAIPAYPSQTGYTNLSELTQTYGTPEKTITGSKRYGWFVTTGIYPSKGLAIVANPNTGQVYEIQVFEPCSLATYETLFGQDLNPQAKPEQEGFF